tara:strand:+ start:31382 stop:32620 length:1239 start_codon:yes stop_codon:yes gene_type:complete
MLNVLFFSSINFLLIIIISYYYKNVSIVLVYALISKLFLVIINNYFFYIIDGNMDALSFERKAWEYGGYLDTHQLINKLISEGFHTTYFYSYFCALFYSFFGRNIFILQSLSIFVSLMSIYLVYLISLKIFDENKKISLFNSFLSASILSIFNYSVLSMREPYVLMFLLLSLYFFLNYIQNLKLRYFILAIIFSLPHYFLHAPMLITLVIYIIYFIYLNIRFLSSKFKLKYLFLSLIIIFPTLLLFTDFLYYLLIKVPYINEFALKSQNLDQFAYNYKNNIILKHKGLASFPLFLIPYNFIEFIYLTPIRAIYFIGSPFIWELKKFDHIIPFIDSSFVLICFTLLVFEINKFKHYNKMQTLILILLISLLLVYSLGTGNFGTAFRHKSKFIILLFILVSPSLFNFLKFKKNE